MTISDVCKDKLLIQHIKVPSSRRLDVAMVTTHHAFCVPAFICFNQPIEYGCSYHYRKSHLKILKYKRIAALVPNTPRMSTLYLSIYFMDFNQTLREL